MQIHFLLPKSGAVLLVLCFLWSFLLCITIWSDCKKHSCQFAQLDVCAGSPADCRLACPAMCDWSVYCAKRSVKCSRKWLFKLTFLLHKSWTKYRETFQWHTQHWVTWLSLENHFETGAAGWAQWKASKLTAFTLKLYFYLGRISNVTDLRFEV